MNIFPLMFALNAVLVSGSSLSDQVHQTPFYIQASPGETAGINCSHSIQSYNRILWYKRSEDRQLQFLGYVYQGTSNPEPGVNVVMKGSAGEGQTCTLTIKELTVSSSAVYFCAASYHSAAYLCCSVRKPPECCFFYLSVFYMLPMHLHHLLR
ncbi:hypothetical protein XENOCAPTIV_002076 [Xenoophorus captivus]|uniref:Ig-like domain-containing protein n=1 Tax=Xenoophorus captivus TaxID=1517983 RepID=A0ABV0R7M8_9TELE